MLTEEGFLRMLFYCFYLLDVLRWLNFYTVLDFINNKSIKHITLILISNILTYKNVRIKTYIIFIWNVMFKYFACLHASAYRSPLVDKGLPKLIEYLKCVYMAAYIILIKNSRQKCNVSFRKKKSLIILFQ